VDPVDCAGRVVRGVRADAADAREAQRLRQHDDHEEWSVMRRLALYRDGRQCRRCGRSSHANPRVNRGFLQVHHLQPRRLFEAGDINKHRLTNLMTLCRSCHARAEVR
jgi:5-methylcytosine-specific restriction endonuclease McrA